MADPASHLAGGGPLVAVCKHGNDSQIAVDALRSVSDVGQEIKDLIGGLQSWSKDIDTQFPIYW